MDTLDNILAKRPPTTDRPLLGQTVLVVEDSRYACEALRLLCLKSGARIRRAGNLMQARRHLSTYRPNVVLVDIGLPDGKGDDLIRELARATPRVEVLLGSSGDPDAAERAISAGADGFLPKPISSIAVFQQAILAQLPSDSIPKMLRGLSTETVEPDRLALRDDLLHVASLLHSDCAIETLEYLVQFVNGIAISIDDRDLASANQKLRDKCMDGSPVTSAIGHLAAAVQETIGRTPRTI